MTNTSWTIWSPDRITPEAVRSRWLDTPPPWRTPNPARWEDRPDKVDRQPPPLGDGEGRAANYIATGGELQMQRVNFSLLLRRPLLVTGPPGIGKSTLAWHLGHALGLGRPLRWEIGSRTTLQEGLYGYDPLGHLAAVRARSGPKDPSAEIEHFLRLGPLGTALLPTRLPRVLLVDDMDKASYDLPNDLLHVFEEGGFQIPELERAGGKRQVRPHDEERDERVELDAGRVRCHHHPVVILTSNEERELSEAFRRRCVGLELSRPEPEILARVARTWFGEQSPEAHNAAAFAEQAPYRDQSIDVILQALFLERTVHADPDAVAAALQRKPDER